MHTFSETGAGVPAFLAKLWRLVDDPNTDHLIYWSKDGRSFIIQNQAQFAHELLPQNYKHNNMASFIRQLNMYGFHKITSIENGGLKFDRDEMEFSHPWFKRNCPYLLEHIKRKIATSKTLDGKSIMKPEAVTKVLQDVTAMRGRQDSLDSRFSLMKQENEALWREIASLRQKHAKQQQIVNKLIHFLISVVQPSRNMSGVKRQTQLMINDNPKNERNENDHEVDCGPIIHELTEELLDEVANDQKNILMHSENSTDSPERPQSSMSMISNNYDFSNHSVDDVLPSGNLHGQDGNEALITTPTSPKTPQNVHITYHVTEVPEADAGVMQPHINEENHLATPMVRKQMQRSQYIRQQNNQKNKRRRDAQIAKSQAKQMRTSQPQESLLLSQKERIDQQRQQYLQQQETGNETPKSSSSASSLTEPVTIKCETQDLNDPVFFLDVFPENIEGNMNDESLTSPIILPSNGQPNVALALTPTPSVVSMPSPNLFSPNNFITDELNPEIFENQLQQQQQPGQLQQTEEQQQQQQQQQLQQNCDLNNLSNGKFSSYLVNYNDQKYNIVLENDNSPTVGTDNTTTTSTTDALLMSPSANQLLMPSAIDNGNKEMAVAKFRSGNGSLDHSDIMRDEVHGHIENVQDELDTLKDLLRGDAYSLDTTTLMGLFNDSDVLNPFSMTTWQNDMPTNDNKKGSELVTYQPTGFDLSDIMELEKNDSNTTVATPSTSRPIAARRSTLDTPRHD